MSSASGNKLLNGKIAIVTGASSGIGAATGRALARAGAGVVLAARRTERLESLRQAIADRGGTALAIPTDVSVRRAVQAMVGQALSHFGRIDILVNNAGVMLLSPVKATAVDEWDRMFDLNVRGLLYCIAATLPTMIEQESGHIVNVGSVAGRRPFYSGTVYSATKFAVRALSAGLRLELSPRYHIRVTDIEPGVVDTELADHISDPGTQEAFAERWSDKVKLSSEDIADAVVYAVTQPAHVNVNELLVRPTDQET